ncbi:MAG: hypothetical protein ND866_28065 [Pyrinomonadaceae bacterium]|nr:hypothetical protein [Pyrinomonadaceae bacterium]
MSKPTSHTVPREPGDADAALRWLERAYEERDAHVVLLGVEPRWDPLHADPRFADLMKRLRLTA